MIVVVEHGPDLRLRRVRLRDRVAARLRVSVLDRQLAEGLAPESSVALAIHAGHLCGPAQRRLLACSLRRVGASPSAAEAQRRRTPVSRTAVAGACRELAAVVDRLAAGPVDVRGVARIRNLLADGAGPLYRESPPGRLRDELRAALAALEPRD